jgi:hypothetical protein
VENPMFKSCLVLAAAIAATAALSCTSKSRFREVDSPGQLGSLNESHSATAAATVAEVLRKVPGTECESMVRVKTARVSIVDYDRLRHDFDFLRDRDDGQIDTWLIERFGYISNAQAMASLKNDKNSISDPVSYDESSSRWGLRQPHSGRSLLMPASDADGTECPSGSGRSNRRLRSTGESASQSSVVFDVKGAGAKNPTFDDDHHSNGLAYFGEAMREYHLERIVQLIFRHSGLQEKTNPIYAVIHLGFKGRYDFGTNLSSALLIRRGQVRAGPDTTVAGLPKYRDLDSQQVNMSLVNRAERMELTMRRYGLTTAMEKVVARSNSYAHTWTHRTSDQNEVKFDFANLQFTRDGALTDFGAYFVLGNFTNELAFATPYFDGALTTLAGTPIDRAKLDIGDVVRAVSPEDSQFITKPEPQFALDTRAWGQSTLVLAALNVVPQEQRPKERLTLLDTPTLASIWLGEEMAAQRSGAKNALDQHCRLVTPFMIQLGFDTQDLTSTKRCAKAAKDDAANHLNAAAAKTIAKFAPVDKVVLLARERVAKQLAVWRQLLRGKSADKSVPTSNESSKVPIDLNVSP